MYMIKFPFRILFDKYTRSVNSANVWLVTLWRKPLVQSQKLQAQIYTSLSSFVHWSFTVASVKGSMNIYSLSSKFDENNNN